MMPSLRGKKKQHPPAQGQSSPPSVDHSAMTRGGSGGAVAVHEEMDDVETSPSRKRKRGHSNPGQDNGEIVLEEQNGNDGEISDGNFSEIDANDMAKWLKVIEQQFSLEILLKNQERTIIETEKAKVEASIQQLEQSISMADATYETPNRYQNYYGQFVEHGTRSQQHYNGTGATSSSRPQRNAAMKAAARNNAAGNICLAKNDQGKVVRVTCPDCSRYDFSNVQGFINHCRIAHKIEYASHEDAVRNCGVEVDLSEFGTEESARLMHMARPGIQSILNTSSTLSGKLPETAKEYSGYKRKLSTTSLEENKSYDFSAAMDEFVAAPVTTRARAQSFNSMHGNTDYSSALVAGLNHHGFPPHGVNYATRRNSLPGPSKNTAKSKRTGGTRASSRRNTSNGMPSPAESETTPTLKHLNKFVRNLSVDYDIDGFVDEMRREKHNMMLLGDEGYSASGDSDVEEMPDTKKPHSGVRRPTGAARTPANWIPPVPGLVELPATRLRNRKQKEEERLANDTNVERIPSTGASETAPQEMKRTASANSVVAGSDADMLDVVTAEQSAAQPRGRTTSGRRRQSTVTNSRGKPLKKSPMEEQAFLSTLPLKIKSRRRRASTNASKSEISTTANERLVQLNQDNPDHDSDETSSDDELGKLRKATLLDGAMTPTSLGTATGFVGLSCGKDAPNVHFVSPVKETPDILARPDLVDGSRFYVKRRIKIGNTSKFIPEAKRSPKMAKFTHKWMIYFVSPPYSAPISTFLSSVTIFLDESFPLPRIIELRVPPFRWVSYGWGEFNLNIRLAFCDPSKNKPMDVVHPLKLDPGKSGREVGGYEGYFDVDLDRNSEFLPGEAGVEYDEVPKMAEVEKMENGAAQQNNQHKDTTGLETLDTDTIRVADPREMNPMSSPQSRRESMNEKRPILPKSGSFSDDSIVEWVSELDDEEVRQIIDTVEPYSAQLHETVKKYPFISDEVKMPYSVAPSKQVFLSWNIGRRKSVEWQRARLIQADILASYPSDTNITNDLTVKAVVVWCRQNEYGPPICLDADNEQLQYCRYCGMIKDSPPPKGQKRAKSTWGVDAYCRCGQEVKDHLAVMKTSSSVQDMIDRNRNIVNDVDRNQNPVSFTREEIRALLGRSDVNVMRWVWQTVSQLNLRSTAPAESVEDTIQSREKDTLAVSAIIARATQSFLTRMIHLAGQQSAIPDTEDEQDEVIIVGTTSGPSMTTDRQATNTVPLVVTPIHILRAIRAGREFDFLTNAGMATGASQGGGGGVSIEDC